MDDNELREFVDDFLSGNIFTSAQVPENESLNLIFMPLVLGGGDMLKPIADDIGCLFEYMSKAFPRSINGYPMFHSFRVMHKDDWKVALKTIKQERVRRQTIPLVRDTEFGDGE
jgi:hypothetical protein